MFRVITLASLVALASCHRQADAPGDAPTGLEVKEGDGQVTVTWNQQSGLTYWIFFQAGSTVTVAGPGVPLIFDAHSPRVVANLVNGFQYAFVMNATHQDSKAGPSTPVVQGFTRPAGASWTPGLPITPRDLNGVAFGPVAVSGIITNRIVAVGNAGTVFTGDYNYTNVSPPGVTAWTQVPPTSLPDPFTSDLSAVTFAATQFIALGRDGSILTSADGSTWVSKVSVPSGGLRMNSIAIGIASGAGLIVAVGEGGSIFTSRDLDTWNPVAPKTPNELFSVSFLNGIFVATGAGGALLTSSDGSGWTVQNSNTLNALRGAAFGLRLTGPRYVAVGDSGTIVTSTDGTEWAPSPVVPPLLQHLRGVTFGSRFVAVGQGEKIAYSDEGTDWQQSSVVDPAGPADLSAVIFTPAMYVAVGTSGANAVSK